MHVDPVHNIIAIVFNALDACRRMQPKYLRSVHNREHFPHIFNQFRHLIYLFRHKIALFLAEFLDRKSVKPSIRRFLTHRVILSSSKVVKLWDYFIKLIWSEKALFSRPIFDLGVDLLAYERLNKLHQSPFVFGVCNISSIAQMADGVLE